MNHRPIPWRAADAAALLQIPGQDSHKYSRGVLGLRTGSSAYPGAAVLGAEAAWRTGIGSVRYIAPRDDSSPPNGLPTPAAAILARRPETVYSKDSAQDRARCDAWLIGSGSNPDTRSLAETEALLQLLAGTAPVVVDAGALGLVSGDRALAHDSPTAPVIITPHLGEFRALWRATGLTPDPDALPGEEAAAILAQELGVTVLLKGSRTIAASPLGCTVVHGPSTPWLATAGTGDVLAGTLGALVATNARRLDQHPDLLMELGATASLLHDAAGRLAAEDPEGRGEGKPITALDVASAIPDAIAIIRD